VVLALEEATASIIMSFAEKLEGDSSEFYRRLASRFREGRELFLKFAEESKRNRLLLVRTYQETITDAIEACFSFKNLSLNEYVINLTSLESVDYLAALRCALELEDKATRFYIEVAEKSRPLLATIPRAFIKVAEARNKRREEIKTLLNRLRCPE
jgi:rubrerythrin